MDPMRYLYDHALQCIFVYFDMEQLARMSVVSRAWLEFLSSPRMPRVGGTVVLAKWMQPGQWKVDKNSRYPNIRTLLLPSGFSLATAVSNARIANRHFDGLDLSVEFDHTTSPATLAEWNAYASRLRSLDVTIECSSLMFVIFSGKPTPVCFGSWPAGLQHATIRIVPHEIDQRAYSEAESRHRAGFITSITTGLARDCPQLQSLKLVISETLIYDEYIDLIVTPLTGCLHLHTLHWAVNSWRSDDAWMSPSTWDRVKQIPKLATLIKSRLPSSNIPIVQPTTRAFLEFERQAAGTLPFALIRK
jgi:hypothetical protein